MQRISRGFLMIVSILNGVMGTVCAALLLFAPDGRFLGMGVLLPVIGMFPLASVFFRDFFWIGLVMLLALGLPNLVAAGMLIRRSEQQYLATLVAGILLLLWCGFELFYMFNVAAVGFCVVGVVSVLASALLLKPSRAKSV
jgi:hypothetical protein